MTPTLPQAVPPQLLPILKSSLTDFLAKTIRPVIDTEKVVWNAKLRRNELYYRGQQSLVYTTNSSGVVDYQPIAGNQLGVSMGQGLEDLYDYVLPFYQGDVDTFIAVIGARSPNGQAQARDKSDDQQVRLKMKADRVMATLDSHWDVSLLHPQVVRGLGLYGTMFSYTRWSTSARKYGTTPVPIYEEQMVPMGPAYYQCLRCGNETMAEEAQALAAQNPQGLPPGAVPCSQCGNPMGPQDLIQPDSVPSLVSNQVEHYPNGSVELSILNPAYCTSPMWVSDLEHAPWHVYETEEDKGALIQAYPELRAKAYEESYAMDKSTASAMGRWTREFLTSSIGYVIPRTRARWLHTQMWVSPASFEYLPNDRDGALRDWMLKTYPDGFKAPMVNGEVMVGDPSKGTPNRIINERLTSVWAICKPKPSESLYCDPYFECMIQMQDTVNDAVSMLIEQAERSNPFVIADPEILDPDMLRQYANVPGEFKFAKPGSVGSLDKGFFRVPAAELNVTLISFIDKYLSWCREITGIVPAIFGGGESGPEKTAREAEMRRNQALMKLNVPWTQLRQFWARTRENGIYQAAKHSDGRILSTDTNGSVQATTIENIWELMDGGWYIQCEESMPQTIGQRRDFFMNVLTMPPESQGRLGMDEPENIVKTQEAVGMSDWETPGYKAVIRLHDIISKLTKGQPMPGTPGPPDPMAGMPGPPGPPQPSIPFDSFLFDPDLALKVLRSWLLGQGADMEQTNPAGYANVMAYAHAISDAIQKPPLPPKPMSTSVTMSFAELAPPVQQGILEQQGIHVDMPPGVPLAMPPQPKLPLAAGRPPGGTNPNLDNPLAGPPPANAPPSDLTARAPLASLSAPPPGVLQ